MMWKVSSPGWRLDLNLRWWKNNGCSSTIENPIRERVELVQSDLSRVIARHGDGNLWEELFPRPNLDLPTDPHRCSNDLSESLETLPNAQNQRLSLFSSTMCLKKKKILSCLQEVVSESFVTFFMRKRFLSMRAIRVRRSDHSNFESR
jgi:hypothetical protein